MNKLSIRFTGLIISSFATLAELGGGVREGAEREDLVFCQVLGNFPQMHVLFFLIQSYD